MKNIYTVFTIALFLIITAPIHSFQRVQQTKTPMSSLAHSFEPVLSTKGKHLDVAELLAACWKFSSVLRKIGQTTLAIDFESNIRKAEALYNSLVPSKKRQSLASLLLLEQESGIHGPNAQLQDYSAACGFLWIRRYLEFHVDMYSAILASRDPKEAALDAYRKQIEPFHGWALRKVFTTKLSTSMPSRDKFLATLGNFKSQDFGEEEEQIILNDIGKLVSIWRPIVIRWRTTYKELDLEDTRRA
uniref:Glycolipid transfer protein domain-containing protein n=1 Tax=Ditylum brightwellii TaxID=49249 RepID=A0A7S4RGW5_9STRA